LFGDDDEDRENDYGDLLFLMLKILMLMMVEIVE
jgi:hypothetical protein